MMILSIRIKLANVAAVQRPHEANPRKHRRPARRRHQDQRFHGRLPLRGRVLGFRQFRDVIAGILEGDELAAARQRDRFLKTPLPTTISH
jgi:hypothetical protein